jgi:peptide deformylase
MTLTILEYPDPRLRDVARAVTVFDEALRRFADDLVATVAATTGFGLSATQVGDERRVLVVRLPDDPSGPQVFVNPEVLRRGAFGLVEESCLSVPGIVGNVVRATQVRVRAADPEGEVFERDLEGMHAVCLQHEIDHLDGKLFIDRLMPWRRLAVHMGPLARARRAAEQRTRAA